MTEQEVEAYLHEHIPLSAAMGVRVLSLGEAGVRLHLPLAPNINHRHTAFGGSIGSAAILAAWTLVHTRLTEAGYAPRVVIQRSVTDFQRPADADFEAFCPAPEPAEWARFLTILRRREKARITLVCSVTKGAEIVGTFEGDFVAFASAESDADSPSA